MYGEPSDLDALDWDRVEEHLVAAGAYWVVPSSVRPPHPRPVWGVWLDGALLLSIGSRVLSRGIAEDPEVVVHLGSETDVVIITGRAERVDDPARIEQFVAVYDAKYDWNYSVEEYGPPTCVEPIEVIAWRSEGWAGRDGFRSGSRWDCSG